MQHSTNTKNKSQTSLTCQFSSSATSSASKPFCHSLKKFPVFYIFHIYPAFVFPYVTLLSFYFCVSGCPNQSIETLQSFKLRAHSYLADPNFNPTFSKQPGKSRETNKRADKAFCVVVIIPPLLPLYLS